MVRFAFYLPHDHPEIAEGVSHAVEAYMRGVGQGPKTICHAFTNDDEGDALTEARWNYVRRLLSPDRPFRFIEELPEDIADRMEKRGYATRVLLDGGLRSRNGYEFHYQARIPWRTPSLDTVSLLFATLPTEYLHEHGPTKVRELALEMASQLRFASGHVGFALRLYWPLRRADESIRAELARHPGIDLRPAWFEEQHLGERVDGVHWLNFLGQPVLGEAGGAELLRSRLQSADATVHELDENRVMVSLGQGPEAGDLASGHDLPTYREFARVLEPWLEPLPLTDATGEQGNLHDAMGFTQEEVRRWSRRFLD
ncbi:type VI immunity family protein [Cystobacter fuscus]|uniref:type VI immunity family protein n=1 Tax=Cystobacter fuscus TaxID=43 RepID=UPI001FE21320|nr:type VI immunity family protein [Cystobacter fuscus]